MPAEITTESRDISRRRIAMACVAVFLLAFGVRFITWQNNQIEMREVQWGVTLNYQKDARHLAAGDFRRFLAGPNPPSDATVLLHPPGYPIFLALIYSIFGDGTAVVVIQLLTNSLAAVLAFLIALRLFSFHTAVISGLLTALAPQFSYHSALMLPDELSAIPILAAVYCFTLLIQRGHLKFAICCGVSIGISCWFRSNALALPLFFAAAAAVLLSRGLRLKTGSILLAAFILTVAPVTIRNYAFFDRFIPLSLGLGTTFLEGLGDYDTDGSLGMPITDEDVMELDVRAWGREDYRGNLLNPDGVERERRRIRIGTAVVRDNPLWFAGSVAQRGLMTLRMERVPAIASERDERETTPPAFYQLSRPLKAIQRIFVTAVILPLALFGVILLLRQRDSRQKAAILSVVPLYYMTTQALIHTEYRYVLASTHILIILAAVTVGFAITKILERARVALHGEGLSGS